MNLKMRWSELYYIKVSLLFCTCRIVLSEVPPEQRCASQLLMPGYTIPHGDIIIEYGNPLDIMCVLVNNPNNGTNTSLWFARNDYRIPSEMIEVLNSTVIKLHIDKPEQTLHDTYTCLQNNTTVCFNTVNVGIQPQTITDFQCIGYNNENLTCTWTAPQNYIKTEYNLTYALGGRSSRFDYACPSVKVVKTGETGNRMSCFWNVSTFPPFRPVHEIYNFTLTMKNEFGKNQINKIFNHFAHVLPEPPENLTAISTTTSSIKLSWMLPLSMQTFPAGIHHRILYQCEYGDKKWRFGGLITDGNKASMLYNLVNLKHAHALCDIRVSLRSAKALPDDESMWSRNASITVRTSSTIPDEPPETNVGSFEIVAFGSSLQYREAYIYWKQISDEQKNGPDFKYMITLEGNDSVAPVELTNIYAGYNELSISKSYVFHIWSQNANGLSTRRSTIYIPAQTDLVQKPLRFSKMDFYEGSYELTWQAPKLLPNQYITNYTIFSCRNKRDRPCQCTGVLNWMIVPNDTTIVKVKLGMNKKFQFAISANTLHSSSGMLWAACTVNDNKNMYKM